MVNIGTGDLKMLGRLLDRYWELKKVLAPGCEPVQIKNMMSILAPHVYGQVLTGAGGGGFLCVISKLPGNQEFIDSILKENVSVYINVNCTHRHDRITEQVPNLTLGLDVSHTVRTRNFPGSVTECVEMSTHNRLVTTKVLENIRISQSKVKS